MPLGLFPSSSSISNQWTRFTAQRFSWLVFNRFCNYLHLCLAQKNLILNELIAARSESQSVTLRSWWLERMNNHSGPWFGRVALYECIRMKKTTFILKNVRLNLLRSFWFPSDFSYLKLYFYSGEEIAANKSCFDSNLLRIVNCFVDASFSAWVL